MSTVSFSANGREVKGAYDSIISGESSFEWALYGYEDGSNEIELVDSGNGLEQLCDEFDEEEYQYAFARVTDPNTKLPRFVFISWCGESVPFTKKGKYNTFTNDVLKYFSGFHIHINARSKFDVDPDEIMKKVKSCSGANYSFHQNQAAKNKFNVPNTEPKVEPKPQENKPQTVPSVPKKNPLNDNSGSAPAPAPAPAPVPVPEPQKDDDKPQGKSMSRRSSCDYNPLEPNASRKNSTAREISHGSVENIREAFEKGNNTNVCPGNISSKISAFQTQISQSSVTENDNSKAEKPSGISSKISAFQNQIQETNENNKREQAIKKDLSSKNLKNWNQKFNDVKKESEINSSENIAVKPPPVEEKKTIPEPQPEVKRSVPEPQPEVKKSVPEPKPDTKQGNTCKALYAYEAAEEGELSFEENEIITNVVDIPGEGWWSGNNSKGEYGMFPSNYVSSDGDNIEEAEVVVEEKSEKPVIDNNEKNISAKVIYAYEAQDDTEINLEEGEIITGIILQDENWAIGFNQKSEQGMFPLNYVELIE